MTIQWLPVNKTEFLKNKAQLEFNKKANIIAGAVILATFLFLIFR